MVITVLGTSRCISVNGNATEKNDQTKSYSGYNVSFNYPGSWFLNSDNTTGIRTIIVIKKQNSSFNSIQFQIQPLPNNGMSEQAAIDEFRKPLPKVGIKFQIYTLT